ncbi:MAG: hypothetical protein PUE81_04290 [Lachnospiraceae bacterium]|nr:hypothetical protein [Lachnospiraceae bacterium]
MIQCSYSFQYYHDSNLDSLLIGQPTAALQLVVKEIVRCTDLVGTNLKELISVLDKSDSKKLDEVINNAENQIF